MTAVFWAAVIPAAVLAAGGLGAILTVLGAGALRARAQRATGRFDWARYEEELCCPDCGAPPGRPCDRCPRHQEAPGADA